MDDDPYLRRDRLLDALAMHDEGVAMMRLSLARRHPRASSTELDAHLHRWLRTRPGAEHGDSDGTPRVLRR